jgi:radical SAM-linked protein
MLTEFKYRITYQITGLLRFLSHKELMRMIGRVLRRAGMPLAFSHGFHPHPLISFGPPRPVGTAGTAEQIDVRLSEFLQPAVLLEKISKQFPKEMLLNDVAHIPLQSKSITASIVGAEYELDWPEESGSPVKEIESFMSRNEVFHKRKTPKGIKSIDIRPGVFDLEWVAPKLKMKLALAPDKYVRPADVLSAMTGWSDDEVKRIKITRTGFNIKEVFPDQTI